MPILSLHEHELKPDVDQEQYEQEVSTALRNMKIPGLLKSYQLKGLKGERQDRYAVLWIFENMEVIQNNFGTLDNPIWPEDWLYYENEILAKFLISHPDKIHFTDYGIISDIDYAERG